MDMNLDEFSRITTKQSTEITCKRGSVTDFLHLFEQQK